MIQAERVVEDPRADLKEKEVEALSKSNDLSSIDKDQLKDTMVISSTVAQLEAPQHVVVSTKAFWQSIKRVEVYVLEISELKDGILDLGGTSILKAYSDLQGAFSKKAFNELLNHGISDMKIEFKEGQEPHNTSLRPMSIMELEELRRYLKENLEKGWIR